MDDSATDPSSTDPAATDPAATEAAGRTGRRRLRLVLAAAIAAAVAATVAAGLVFALSSDGSNPPSAVVPAGPSADTTTSAQASVPTAPPTPALTATGPSGTGQTDSPPAVVPLPAGSVVYSTAVGGVGDLGYLWSVRVLAPGSSQPVELARTPVDPGHISPDGRHIAWVKPDPQRRGEGSLMVADLGPLGSPALDFSRTGAAADSSVEIASGVLSSPGASTAWSPDSRRLAFADAAGDVHTIGVDGRSRTDVPARNDGHRHSFAWSPDSRVLAVGTGPTLSLVTIDGSAGPAELSLSETGWYPGNLSWSPGGDTLAAVSAGGDEAGSELRLVDVTTGTVRVVDGTALLQSGTAWLTDGAVVGVRYQSALPNGDGYCEIDTIDPVTGTVVSRTAISPDRPVPNPSAVQLHVVTG